MPRALLQYLNPDATLSVRCSIWAPVRVTRTQVIVTETTVADPAKPDGFRILEGSRFNRLGHWQRPGRMVGSSSRGGWRLRELEIETAAL
jgi:hypothetical protein